MLKKYSQHNITNLSEHLFWYFCKSPQKKTSQSSTSLFLTHTHLHVHTEKHTCLPYHHSRVVWQSDSSSGVELSAVLCCAHLSPPAILASVIPLVHLNTDAPVQSSALFSPCTCGRQRNKCNRQSITGKKKGGKHNSNKKNQIQGPMTAGETVRWCCLDMTRFPPVSPDVTLPFLP